MVEADVLAALDGGQVISSSLMDVSGAPAKRVQMHCLDTMLRGAACWFMECRC